ncbi:MAG: phenylalanine--tRNA ligase subunit beta [Spiroplasma sp.]|nr:phenylalanine--tRNA ligase subunit beta [Spiroplasma sp.]
MIVSKKILSQWVNIRKIKDQEIASALNSLGFEVEKVVNLTTTNTNLIVGEILKVTKHPNSEKLNLCTVNIGKKILTIICGANNVKPGIKVIVAQISSTLANGLEIASREIKGVISQGMICSLEEIGLNPEVLDKSDLAGIVHLPENALVGSLNPLNYLALDDTIFEIQLTLNRSDCLAMYYLAQELSHYFKLPLKKITFANIKNIKVNKAKSSSSFVKAFASLNLNILDQNSLVTPILIKRILQLANIKSTNFIDDLLNLIMLELGQPVICFNGEQITDPMIIQAKHDNLKDGLKYFKHDILFANKKNPFSNLGNLTLSNYLVDDTTKSLRFFSVNFDNYLVQKQIKTNNFNVNNCFLQRLTKQEIPTNYLFVFQRLIFWLKQFAIKFEVVNFINHIIYQRKSSTVTINWQKINQILGTNFSITEITSALKVVGCQVLRNSLKLSNLRIRIPSYRPDLSNINDFTEEVARIIGYNKIPEIKPEFAIMPIAEDNLAKLIVSFKNYLLAYGFHQVKTYNLTSTSKLSTFNFFNYQKPITLSLPMSPSRKVMRFSLIPSLLEICRLNASYKQNDLKIFTDEVIYTKDFDDYDHHLAFIVNGDFFANQIKVANNYLLIKGFFEGWLMREVNKKFSQQLTYQTFKNPKTHPFLSANISYNNLHFATIAAIHPEFAKTIDLDQEIFLVEINFSKLLKIIANYNVAKTVKFENWSKFNPLSRDLSIIISDQINYGTILSIISATKIKNLQDLSLIDYYVDDKLQEQKKHSLTFNLEFNSMKEQLDEDKISDAIKQVQKILKEKFKAVIR